MCRNVLCFFIIKCIMIKCNVFFPQNVIPKNPNLYSSFSYVKKKALWFFLIFFFTYSSKCVKSSSAEHKRKLGLE